MRHAIVYIISALIFLSLGVKENGIQAKSEKVSVEFESKDGLLITADLYEVENPKLMILLCHQAGYSRGEYIKTALRLNELGYSCMAIDQRSGKGVNGVVNQTNKRATAKELSTNYLDAKPDIQSAIAFLYKKNHNQSILIVGSSYSASLVLLIGKGNNKVKAVATFSPGEYIKGINVTSTISNYNKPVFVTSSNSETLNVEALVSGISSDYLIHYKPKEKGIHGSRALWESTEGSEGYWNAFLTFLKSIE